MMMMMRNKESFHAETRFLPTVIIWKKTRRGGNIISSTQYKNRKAVRLERELRYFSAEYNPLSTDRIFVIYAISSGLLSTTSVLLIYENPYLFNASIAHANSRSESIVNSCAALRHSLCNDVARSK